MDEKMMFDVLLSELGTCFSLPELKKEWFETHKGSTQFRKDYIESGVDNIYSIFNEDLRNAIFIGHYEYWKSLCLSSGVYLSRLLNMHHANKTDQMTGMLKLALEQMNDETMLHMLAGYELMLHGAMRILAEIYKDNRKKFEESSSKLNDEFFSHIFALHLMGVDAYPVALIKHGTPWIEEKIKDMLKHGRYVEWEFGRMK